MVPVVAVIIVEVVVFELACQEVEVMDATIMPLASPMAVKTKFRLWCWK